MRVAVVLALVVCDAPDRTITTLVILAVVPEDQELGVAAVAVVVALAAVRQETAAISTAVISRSITVKFAKSLAPGLRPTRNTWRVKSIRRRKLHSRYTSCSVS